MSANPIVAVHPQAVEDEPDDIEVHAGKIFQLKEQNQLQDFIEFAQIPAADAKTQELIDFVFGMVQQESKPPSTKPQKLEDDG